MSTTVRVGFTDTTKDILNAGATNFKTQDVNKDNPLPVFDASKTPPTPEIDAAILCALSEITNELRLLNTRIEEAFETKINIEDL